MVGRKDGAVWKTLVQSETGDSARRLSSVAIDSKNK